MAGRTEGFVSARRSPGLRANLISRAEQLFLPRRILDSHQILDSHRMLVSITSWTAIASRAATATAETLLRVPAASGAHLQPPPRRLWPLSRCPCSSPLLKRVDIIPSVGYFSFLVLYFSLLAAWGQSHTGWCRQPSKSRFQEGFAAGTGSGWGITPPSLC